MEAMMHESNRIFTATELARVPFAFLGVAFARAWVSLLYANPAAPVPLPFSFPTAHMMFDVAYVAVAIIIAFAARRLATLGGRPWAPLLALGLMLASTGSALASIQAPLAATSASLGLVAALLGGSGFVLFSLMNVEVFAALSTLRIVLYLSFAYVLGGLLAFFGNGMAPLQFTWLVLLLPAVAVVCVHTAYRETPPDARPRSPYPKFSYPYKLYILMALYSFAYGLRQSQLVAGAGRGSTYATMLVMAIVFASAVLFGNRLRLTKVSLAPMLFMVCGFLLIPAQNLVGDVFSSYLISTSYTLMHVFVLVLLISMARKTRVPAAVIVAPLYAVQLFSLAGDAVDAALGSSGLSTATQATAVAILVAVLIVVNTVLLLSERKWDSHWSVALDEESLEAASREEDRLEARCAELAQLYGLSPREREILGLLARKRTMAAIGAELYIAQGTVKAHVRHIYEKMGINTRKELFTLLGVG